MKTILFVCTGNVCRSPMAEGFFRQAVQGRSDYRVLSAAWARWKASRRAPMRCRR